VAVRPIGVARVNVVSGASSGEMRTVSKSRVIEQITKIVRAGRADAITDLRDESDRDGLRLVIELKRDADVEKLIRTLFLKTQLKKLFRQLFPFISQFFDRHFS